jgi:hypothetical protein
MRWIRVDVSWAAVQAAGPTSYDWVAFDRIMHGAHNRGLKVLVTLADTPAWDRPAGCPSEFCHPASDPPFARFAAAAAKRYAPLGVHTWEIWNEENTPGGWEPAPDAAQYTALLKQASRAIRGVDKTAHVVTGGLAAVLSTNGNVATRTFLRRVCDLGGNKVIWAVGYHPYTFPYLASYQPTTWDTAWQKIATTNPSMLSILRSHGTPDVKIWLTEYGAPTDGPGAAADSNAATADTDHVTEAWQARLAVNAIRTAAHDPHVAALFWYADRDLSADATSTQQSFGLRRADGSTKPAFTAIDQLMHS